MNSCAVQFQPALCGDMAVDNDMRGKKRNLVLFVFVSVCLVLWGARELLFSSSAGLESKFAPDRAYSGRIVVSVVERMTGPEKNLQFLIDLNRGDISQSEKTEIEVHANPRGRIDDCQREGSVALPDGHGQNVAVCGVDAGRDVVSVFNKESSAQVRRWSADKNWKICGSSWSPDSGSIAVLLEKGRTDLGLLGLFSAASGHPIPLETFQVTLLSAKSKSELHLPVIRRDSPSGWARIDWIQ
jgi:hypothetical protein